MRSGDWCRDALRRDRIVVLFEEVGYRTLSLEAVAAKGLLEVAS